MKEASTQCLLAYVFSCVFLKTTYKGVFIYIQLQRNLNFYFSELIRKLLFLIVLGVVFTFLLLV